MNKRYCCINCGLEKEGFGTYNFRYYNRPCKLNIRFRQFKKCVDSTHIWKELSTKNREVRE